MPHPRAIAIAIALSMIGTLLSTNSTLLGFGWIAVILPLATVSGLLWKHLRFVGVIILPLGVALFIVWYFIVGSPPGQPIGSDPLGGAHYAATTVLRLLILGALAQFTFLPIDPEQLPYVLSQVGFRGSSLIVLLSTFALIPELNQRATRVLTARYARGLVKDRSFISRIKQLPHLIRPLLTGSLRIALQRTEAWEQWGYFDHVEELEIVVGQTSKLLSVGYLLLAISWLALAIFLK